jgi:hypothetical protein
MGKTLISGTGTRARTLFFLSRATASDHTIKEMMIMSKMTDRAAAVSPTLTAGTDHSYAAAYNWIKQAAATAKTPAPPTEQERPDAEELVGALLQTVPSEHSTAIVAHQIRQTLTIHAPGPAKGAAQAGLDTARYADPYSARCPDCDNPTGAAAAARRLLGRWAE